MIAAEIGRWPENGIDDKNGVTREYQAVVDSLQHDLKVCRDEQKRIRTAMNDIVCENKNIVNVVRDSFYHVNNNGYYESVENRECIENLHKQIELIRLEKDAIFQLWQMSLKAIDILEQEIKETNKDGKNTKYYEDQVRNIKIAYSEAIKTLETKLLQAKENFGKKEMLEHSAREKINKLTNDKIELEGKLINIKNNASLKEENDRIIMEKLKTDLNMTKQELGVLNISKIKLENELVEMRGFTTRIVANYQESKEKVAEAIELVETAVKEREIVLQREAMIIDEKKKLMGRLATLSDEFVMRLDKELRESKENYEDNIKKYITEIKELKSQLRHKTIELNHVKCEYSFMEQELEQIRHGSQNYLKRSQSEALLSEQKLKDSQYKLETHEESLRRKFDDKIRRSETQIIELKKQFADVNDRLHRIHVEHAKELDERTKDSDHRVKEVTEKYANLESLLTRALDERECITRELLSLKSTYDSEIARRENERSLLEKKIQELQDNTQKANDLAEKFGFKAETFEKQIKLLTNELEERKNLKIVGNDVNCTDAEGSIQLQMIQTKYEEKYSELVKYVNMHKDLSAKWKEEAQLLALKFHNRYKELRSKVNMLKKENKVLTDELISWRQVSLYHTQGVQRYDQDDGAR